MTKAITETIDGIASAVENLARHQEQCDMDGVMVKVSRQALDEVLGAIEFINTALRLAAQSAAPVGEKIAADLQKMNPGMSGRKIIEGLEAALAGDFSAVTIGGQRWVKVDPAAPPPIPPEVSGWQWLDGSPKKPWSFEWFIAETTYGDRVVLVALPDGWAYDFKTADDTYIKRDKIKRWMQFPDSQFIAALPANPGNTEP